MRLQENLCCTFGGHWLSHPGLIPTITARVAELKGADGLGASIPINRHQSSSIVNPSIHWFPWEIRDVASPYAGVELQRAATMLRENARSVYGFWCEARSNPGAAWIWSWNHGEAELWVIDLWIACFSWFQPFNTQKTSTNHPCCRVSPTSPAGSGDLPMIFVVHTKQGVLLERRWPWPWLFEKISQKGNFSWFKRHTDHQRPCKNGNCSKRLRNKAHSFMGYWQLL